MKTAKAKKSLLPAKRTSAQARVVKVKIDLSPWTTTPRKTKINKRVSKKGIAAERVSREIETADDWSDEPTLSAKLEGGFYDIREQWRGISERALALDEVHRRRLVDECIKPFLAGVRDQSSQK